MAGGAHLGSQSRLSGLADGLKGYRFEIVGLLVACWGLVTLAAMLGLTDGVLIGAFSEGVFAVFGVGAPAIGLALVAIGAALVLHRPLAFRSRRALRVLGLLLIWLACMVAAELAAPSPGWRDSYGGALGYLLGSTLRALAGAPVGWAVALLLAAEGLHLTLHFSWRKVLQTIARALRRSAGNLWALVRLGLSSLSRSVVQAVRQRVSPQPSDRARAEVFISAPPEIAKPADVDGTGEEEAGTEEGAAVEAVDEEPAEEPDEEPLAMPSLDLFDPPQRADGSEDDDAVRATIIEEALASFEIPAKVKDVQRGPAFTRFGLEPGYTEATVNGQKVLRKIRVSKVSSLVEDLELALRASPIRVEAPIPGRPLIGLEVPNTAVSLVRIRELLGAPQFQEWKQPLRLALGKEVSGQAFVVSLSSMPHLLIAGATGTGKSVCISAILTSLLFAYRPSELRLLLVDRKQVELVRYNGVPHLLGRVETTIDGAVALLRWACKEMDDRYTEFANRGVRDLAGYEKLAGVEKLPRIVIVIDELADLMLSAPDDAEKPIARLAQMARATGIHLVLATQRPSVDVVTGMIKTNIPARISFATATQTDSRVILDSVGAEDLIGYGDMLFVSPDSGKLHRLQGTFVSEEETRRLVEFWRRQVGRDERLPVAPWSSMLAEEEDQDEMFDQAVAVAREVSAVSASYLQRRLRVGYPRAANLLGLLEEAGIVGPATGGGRSRPVLQPSEDGDELFDEGELEELVDEDDEA